MPASNWESLIVKRSISELSSATGKKGSSSSLSSLASSCHSDSGFSSTQIKASSRSAPQSRSSTPLFGQSSSIASLPQKSLSTVTRLKSTLPARRSLKSPVLSQTDSALGNQERKTLVPIAPFLCGHAHSFSSFETNKLEHKLQPRGLYTAVNREPQSKSSLNNRCQSEDSSALAIGCKRRASSLDSDSYSSSSGSLTSRSTTPNPEQNSCIPSGGREKKVRRIVVPSETLSKLLNGSLKLEFRRNSCGSQGTQVVLKPATKTASSSECIQEEEASVGSKTSSTFDLAVSTTKSGSDFSVATILGSPCIPVTVASSEGSVNNLHITPVGSLEDIIKSGSALPTGVASNLPETSNTSSIKSHIEAINSHLQAISKAIGGGSNLVPLELPKFAANFISQIKKTTAISEQTAGDNSGSAVNKPADLDRTASFESPTDCFVPVGILEIETAGGTLPGGRNYITSENDMTNSFDCNDVQSTLPNDAVLRNEELDEFCLDSFVEF